MDLSSISISSLAVLPNSVRFSVDYVIIYYLQSVKLELFSFSY